MQLSTIVRVLLLACLAVPALAGQGPVVPPEWEGIWMYETLTTVPCDIGIPVKTTGQDTLCAGDPAFQPDDGVEYDCVGTATADFYEIECTGQSVDEGCTVSFIYQASGSRVGDMFTSTGTLLANANDPDECGFTQICTAFSSTSTRIDAEPAACKDMPVEERTWGSIKTRYR